MILPRPLHGGLSDALPIKFIVPGSGSFDIGRVGSAHLGIV
jgi:hypothetical protein